MSANCTSSFVLYPSPCPSLPLPPNLQCFYKPKRKQSVSPIQAGPAVVQSQNAKPEIDRRRTANFHPSIWGDRFINYDYSEHKITHAHYQKQVDELKEIVRRDVFTNLKAGGDDFAHKLELIDAIQRLGVAYHFEREIEEALERIHGTTCHDHYDGDLHSVALGFRLLRQHGYNVSCGRYIPRSQ
ncbi:PREDICTED: (-)-germacrene D synthase [Prunus dulcis]|uniref:PREDICTED: (-)-germacrene D synthase n=1 Tax=Prunus dulcis TaxID=3755 RepID=A0A5E4GPL7_PRUDU|nr:PREDICTED: (-)-germacrene D synthase [Prunus dulcis]